MKKIITLLVILITYSNYAQNKLTFTKTDYPKIDLTTSFIDYEIVKIHDQITTIADGIAVSIEYQESFDYILDEQRLLADKYTVAIKTKDDVEIKNIYELGFDGKYFHNKGKDAANQFALSIYDNRYTIFIKKGDQEFYMEPLQKFSKDAPADLYIYYKVTAIKSNDIGACGLDTGTEMNATETAMATQDFNESCKTVDLNFCVDYSFYATYNSINSTINRTLEILNLSQLNFTVANGLNYDVDFQVMRHFILTCSDCNYWPTTGDINTNWIGYSPAGYYNQMFNETSDVRIFWQANLPPTTYNGLASFVNNLECAPFPYTNRYACLKNFTDAPGTNKTRYVLSHEIGHTFNCSHTSLIMGYGDNYTGNSWDASSIYSINEFMTSFPCIFDCVPTLCHNTKVDDLLIDVANNGTLINVSWVPVEDVQFQVRLFNYATDSWSDYSTIDYPLNSISYPVNSSLENCSLKYKVEIVPLCSAIAGISAVGVLAIPNACNLSNASFDTPKLQYYPNPFQTEFHVSSEEVIEKISIYNLLGQKLLENQVKQMEYTLDLSSLASSTYVLKVEYEKKSALIKIVKE